MTKAQSLDSHVKNRVVTSEKAKSQRENESSLPDPPHRDEISDVRPTVRGLSLTEPTHLLSHHRWLLESDTP